jgi:hypothetical protein
MIPINLVKLIPWWWCFVPFLGTELATTIHTSIYFPKKLYEEIHSGIVSSETESIYLHELVHVERQKQYGSLMWNLSYIFNSSFRLQEELVAIEKQMKFLLQHKRIYDITKKAKQFSSSDYLWALSFADSKKVLEALWQKCLIE